MKAKVTLLARVNDGTRDFPYVPVQIHKRAIVLPVTRESNPTKGRLQNQAFGLQDIIGFYARYQDNGSRKLEPLGKDPVAATIRFLELDQDFARIQKGLLPLNPPEPKTQPQSDRNLRGCAAEFITELPTLGKKKYTIYAYTKAVNDFVSPAPKKPSIPWTARTL